MSTEQKPSKKRPKIDLNFNSKNSGGSKKSPFNFYWIYGIILAVLIGINLFSLSGPEKTKLTDFSEMVKNHDVERIVVVNKEIVEITIKKDRLSDSKYDGVDKKIIRR